MKKPDKFLIEFAFSKTLRKNRTAQYTNRTQERKK